MELLSYGFRVFKLIAEVYYLSVIYSIENKIIYFGNAKPFESRSCISQYRLCISKVELHRGSLFYFVLKQGQLMQTGRRNVIQSLVHQVLNRDGCVNRQWHEIAHSKAVVMAVTSDNIGSNTMCKRMICATSVSNERDNAIPCVAGDLNQRLHKLVVLFRF